MLRLEDTWLRKEINARPEEQEGEEEGGAEIGELEV